MSKKQVNGKIMEKKSTPLPQPFSNSQLLTLPFFEDFSNYGPLPLKYPYPDTTKWTGRSIYINSEYADSMISIGVATLDAVNAGGNPYPYSSSYNKNCDTLASKYFKIVPNSTPLYFSFFYQAGGKGDVPEEKDSLFVDFFTPEYQWVTLWAKAGGTEQHSFTFESFRVPDTLVVDNLRFRFRNYTSNKQGDDPDLYGNADIWNIDYIRLNRTNNPDTLKNLNDITIVAPLLPSLLEYYSVPYQHLGMAWGSSPRGNNPLTIRTMFPDLQDVLTVERTHISYDIIKNEKLISIGEDGGIASEMLPEQTSTISDFFNPRLNQDINSSMGHYQIKSYINISGIDQNKINDTVSRTELYTDYYAHDDGSSEFYFALGGQEHNDWEIANRFRIFRKSNNPDTLKAIYIYFNQVSNTNSSEIKFRLCVWKNNGEVPGDLIYESSEEYIPDTTQQYLNEFTRYELKTPLLVSDTIFIGLKQDESFRKINIGYDLNTNSLSDFYYKYEAFKWINPYSYKKGSLMIRPSFGSEYQWVATHETIVRSEIKAYPNPAHEQLNFILPEQWENESAQIKVIDILGTVLINSYTSDRSIDISQLKPGFYLAVITVNNQPTPATVKFIKN